MDHGTCCVTGSVATGTPSGALETMAGGTTVYVAAPDASSPPPDTAVVIATDVFGLRGNAKLLADSFAKRGGFLTVVPDMFGATALPVWIMDAAGALMKKKKRGGWAASVMAKIVPIMKLVFLALPRVLVFFWYNGNSQKKIPMFDALMADLREKRGIKRICIIGYCYGAPISIHYGKGDAVSAFATAHGKIRVPDDIEPLVRPGLFICADNDFAFPDQARLQAEAMLRAKTSKMNTNSNDDIDYYYKFKHYPGAPHGFGIRGDEADEVVQRAKEDAFEQAVAFFQEHTK